MKKVVIMTRYGNDDPEFDSDYYEILIHDEHGKKLAHFGDYYHDKGWEKTEGFVLGLKICYPNLDVENISVADFEV